MKVFRRWARLTDDEIATAYASSTSVSGMLRTLGFSKIGTQGFSFIKARLHLMGMSYEKKALEGMRSSAEACKDRRVGMRKPAEEVFGVNSCSRATVKRHFIRTLAVLDCSICGQKPSWSAKPLVMRLDHINGISNDNRYLNLRLVCPNCDSQLETFAGRQLLRYRTKKPSVPRLCRIASGITRRKYPRPSKAKLTLLLQNESVLSLSRTLGVKSENTIRKWCKSYGLAIGVANKGDGSGRKRRGL